MYLAKNPIFSTFEDRDYALITVKSVLTSKKQSKMAVFGPNPFLIVIFDVFVSFELDIGKAGIHKNTGVSTRHFLAKTGLKTSKNDDFERSKFAVIILGSKTPYLRKTDTYKKESKKGSHSNSRDFYKTKFKKRQKTTILRVFFKVKFGVTCPDPGQNPNYGSRVYLIIAI